MPRVDFPAFFRQSENLILAALTGSVGLIALAVGPATLGGVVSPSGAMIFAALLCAVAAFWYARGFLEERTQDGGIALLISCAGWILATLSFLARAGNTESRAAGFFLLGGALLVLTGASLAVSPLLVGAKTSDDAAEAASTRSEKTKADAAKDLGDALRDARDL